MFSFLNSSLLWALPLAGAPILIHLIFLRRARRLPFSDLTLLKAVYARSLPATRLRQWLLMLVRCLMLAFLILGFARPVAHYAGASSSEEGLDLVVLMDTSWSMGAQVRGKACFDWAMGQGVALIRGLKDSDRIAVAGFSEGLEGELRWAEGRSAGLEALKRLRLGYGTGDIAPAFSAAYTFLSRERPKEGRRRVILVLSDNARHLFRGLPASGVQGLPGYDPQVVLLGLEWLESLDNAGVLEAGLRELAERSGGYALSFKAAVYGAARPTEAALWVKERRVDQKSLRLDPRAPLSQAFTLPAVPNGELWGRVELRRDALAADDAYYFSLKVQPYPQVLLVYGSPRSLQAGGGAYFFKKLLGEGRELPYRLDVADLGRLRRIRLEDYGAVILDDFRELPAGMSEALERYVAHGGGLWVVAGTQAGAETYRPLARVLPGSLGLEQDLGRLSGIFPEPAATSVEGGRAFSWTEFELREVALKRRYALTPAPGSQVWFHDSAGRPLLAQGEFGSGRVLLWASALDIQWTNLGLKPVFAAVVDTGLRQLTGYAGSQRWRVLRVGEPIVRLWGPREAAPAEAVVRGPDGRRTKVMVRERRAEFADTRVPGLYFLEPLSGSGGVEAYAVNVDRTGPEGDLRLPDKLPYKLLRSDSLRDDFIRALYGREAASAFLALVAALFVLESVLSRPREGSEAGLAKAPTRELDATAQEPA